jgi:hypothetical protein
MVVQVLGTNLSVTKAIPPVDNYIFWRKAFFITCDYAKNCT